MDAITAVSGSGPAYFALLAEAMIEAGILLGLSREISTTLVVQTMLGTAQAAPRREDASRRAARVGHLAGRHDDRRDPRARAGRRARGVPQCDSGGDDAGTRARRGWLATIEIVVVEDPAHDVAERLAAAARHGGHIVLTGGSTPRDRVRARGRARAGLDARSSSGGATSAASRPTTSARTTAWRRRRSSTASRWARCTGCAASSAATRARRVRAGARRARALRSRPARARTRRPHRVALSRPADARRDRAARRSAPRRSSSRTSTASR